jgi:hypothetical protein
MNKLLLLFCFTFPSWVYAQFSDNFNDGNISSNPQWLGEVSEFTVDVKGRLQLNSEAITAAKMLYTLSPIGDSARWTFDVFMDFNTSSANYCTIYLSAEDSIFNTTDAFFAKLGGTKDNIQLWQRTNGNETLLLESDGGIFDSDSTALRVSIYYSGSTLSIDTGFTSLQTIANTNAILPAKNNRYFVLNPVYTSTRSTKFWFDNIQVVGGSEKVHPIIVSQQCIANNKIEITFSEDINPTSLQTQNFLVNNALMPSEIMLGNRSINLTFTDALPLDEYLSILVKNISDDYANFLTDTLVYTFCGTVSMANHGDILINEIMADPTPNENLPEEEYLELYNRSNKAIALLSLDIFNSQNNLQFASDTVLLPGQYYTLCSSANAQKFKENGVDNVLSATDFPSLTNTSDSLTIVSNGTVVDVITYNTTWYDDPKSNGGFSLERIDPTSVCNDPFNLAYCNATNQGTPSQINSVHKIYSSPFQITSIDALPNKTLLLKTSSALDILAFTASDLILQNEENIGIEQNPATPNSYSINFEFWPEPGTEADVTIQSLKSCRGKELDTALTVTIPTPSTGNELHITELMIDPSPTVGLPNAEYIELYNNATYPVYLSDFELIKYDKTYSLPQLKIPANDYVLLISNNDTDLFQAFDFISLQSFPPLLNTEDNIGIRHQNSGWTEEISYTLDYYNDEEKNDGGYSLENIRPSENCLGKLNFSASKSPIGGTPGLKNSIIQSGTNNTSISLERSTIQDEFLILIFDRNIHPSEDFGFESLTFSPTMPYSVRYFHQDSLVVDLFLLDNVYEYQLRLTNIEDCLQNTLDTTLSLFLGIEPNKGDLIFTEIMADPTPHIALPEVEYLELYNTTDRPIRLNNLALNQVNLQLDYVLPPKEYVLISNNAESFSADNSLITEALSSTFLTNSGKHLELINTLTDEIITEINYSNKWHTNDIAQDGGISLELNNPALTCYNSSLFWGSSKDSKGGTPGQPNSLAPQALTLTEATLSYYNNQQLSFGFTRPIQIDSMVFSMDNMIDSAYLSHDAHLLHLKLINDLPDNLIEIEMHVNQCNTNHRLQIQLPLQKPVIPKSNQLLINEILYDANVNQNEFIELYNPTSTYISLYNLRYHLGTKTGVLDTLGLIMPPQSYLFLTSDTNKLDGFRNKNPLVYFPYFELPTLSNSGLEFGISIHNDTIDYVSVSDEFHYPLLLETTGISLERIINPNLASPLFTSAPESSDFASPGLKNATTSLNNNDSPLLTLSDNYISANGDGHQDFVSITYNSPKLESIEISIFDRAGFLVKRIAKNYIHSGTSSFVWKGENDAQQLTEAGIYILVLDISSDGKTNNRIRKTITISR